MGYPAVRSTATRADQLILLAGQRDFPYISGSSQSRPLSPVKAAAVTIRKKAYNKKPIIFHDDTRSYCPVICE